MAKAPGAPEAKRRKPRSFSAAAKAVFLTHLAGTAHVARSAQAAGFEVGTAYRRRAEDAAFAADWAAALTIGYERIETALIRKALRLEDHAPIADPASGMSVADGEVDVDLAKFLLGRHHKAVAQTIADQRAVAFRASRDGAEATLLTKIRAYAKAAGLTPPFGGAHAVDGAATGEAPGSEGAAR